MNGEFRRGNSAVGHGPAMGHRPNGSATNTPASVTEPALWASGPPRTGFALDVFLPGQVSLDRAPRRRRNLFALRLAHLRQRPHLCPGLHRGGWVTV